MAALDASVFKSYDIRGVYPEQLDERFAWLLGRALPAALGAGRVVVGRDARLSSPALYGALIGGLKEAGARVGGLGLCPTELVYYAAGARREWELGVMITASHNPPEYNGFKIVRAGGEPVSASSGLDEVRRAMEGMDCPEPAAGEPDEQVEALADCVAFALDAVGRPHAAALRVVADAGNGVAGLLWDAMAEAVGVETVRLNWEPDGRFPAHHPDPSRRENLEELVEAIAREGADLGFAYDGDADRVVAALADGHVVDGSEMTVCLAERMLAEQPDACFGVGQTISRKALDHFAACGVEPVMVPVGHAKIKALMRASPAMRFAGEDAGHYYFRDFFCCDSSLMTTLHLLHLSAGGGLYGLIEGLPGPWHRPLREPSFAFAEQDRALAVCRDVARSALGAAPHWREVCVERHGAIRRRCRPEDIEGCDGVRVDYEDWWFCVRPSGTEPIARLALEARTERLLKEKTDELSARFAR